MDQLIKPLWMDDLCVSAVGATDVTNVTIQQMEHLNCY